MSYGREERYAFEKYFDTVDGTLLGQGRVVATRFEITYTHFTLYPVTSAQDVIKVSELLKVFRWLMDDARGRGFEVITLQAARKRPGKPGRMLDITRRLS